MNSVIGVRGRGYHETITQFYLHIISDAIERTKIESWNDFLAENSFLIERSFLGQFYSPTIINSPSAKVTFLLPDLKRMPGNFVTIGEHMKIEGVPFMTTDWNQVAATNHPGETGSASWKTIEVGSVRVRVVDYTPGYLADHWCSRGHILFVLEGELVTELKDGRRFTLHPGMSYQVATDAEPHRSSTAIGAKLFVVD